jgi:hypothetical protein
MRSKTESNLPPGTERQGVGRRHTPAGRLLPCVKGLELKEDEQLEGQQSYAEMNKIASPTDSRSPEFLHRQIHLAALAWMVSPMTQTMCPFTLPPHQPMICHTASLQRLTFLLIPPKFLSSTTVRKTTWNVEHLSSMNLSCNLTKVLARMEWSTSRMAPIGRSSRCSACASSSMLSFTKIARRSHDKTCLRTVELLEYVMLYVYRG